MHVERAICFDVRPRRFAPGDDLAQTISVPPLDFAIPIEYSGILPMITIRRPTLEELSNCTHVHLTSADSDWDPYDSSNAIGAVDFTSHITLGSDLCSEDSPLENGFFLTALLLILLRLGKCFRPLRGMIRSPLLVVCFQSHRPPFHWRLIPNFGILMLRLPSARSVSQLISALALRAY